MKNQFYLKPILWLLGGSGLFIIGFCISDLSHLPDPALIKRALHIDLTSSTALKGPVGTFKTAFDNITKKYYKPINKRELKFAAMEGLVEAVEDPNTNYFAPKEAQQFMQDTLGRNVTGIGALLSSDKTGARIRKVYPGTPASKVGLKANDAILEVNNKKVEGLPIDLIVEQIRGKENSSVKLKVKRESTGNIFIVNPVRKKVDIPSVEYKFLPESKIGYIAVSQFGEKTPDQFDTALFSLRKNPLRGLVIDLRGNGGGLMRSGSRMLSRFINGSLVVNMKSRNQTKAEYAQRGNVLPFKYPVVTLIDGESASCSEIFAGVLQDYRLSTIIGEHSYGKDSVQQPIPLIDQAMAKITVMRYILPSGQRISRKVNEDKQYVSGGIKPDIEVPLEISLDYEQGNSKTDNQLKKAIEHILKDKK